MRDAGEHVEAFRGAADHFTDEFAGDAGNHHAVAREPLHEPGVRAEAAEMRRAVQRDVEVAAPGVFNARFGKLRKYLGDAGPEDACRIEWIDARVTHSTTEQQAVVR